MPLDQPSAQEESLRLTIGKSSIRGNKGGGSGALGALLDQPHYGEELDKVNYMLPILKTLHLVKWEFGYDGFLEIVLAFF